MMSYNWVTAALSLLSALFFYLQAAAEEKQCLRKFGRQCRDYAARVPMFNIIVGVFRR